MKESLIIDLEPRHLKIVQDILKKYPYAFYVFGSCVSGNTNPFSDLDLLCLGDISWLQRDQLQNDFEESDLPFKVDIIYEKDISNEFKDHILKKKVLLQGDN